MKQTDSNEIPAKQAPMRKRRSSTEPIAQSEATVKSKRVTDFQSHAREVVTEKFADIMEAMAQESIQGSLPHTKYLFEIGGIKEELQRQVENNGEPTLADLLLEEVRRHSATDTTNFA